MFEMNIKIYVSQEMVLALERATIESAKRSVEVLEYKLTIHGKAQSNNTKI